MSSTLTYTPPKTESIVGAHICLREITREDVPIVNRWRADRDVTRTLVGTFRFVNIETDEGWFDRYLANRDHEVRLGVVADQGKLLGVVYLNDIDWVNRSAVLGLMIGAKERWGQGIGTAVTKAAVDHAFNDLNLHRISLQVLEDHGAALTVYQRAGFAEEGRLVDAVFKDGRYRTLVAMAIVADDEHARTGRHERTADDR